MAQTRTPKYMPGFGKSYAMLSESRDTDTAVIFVHGFGGKPTSTWRNFQGLVDEYSTKYAWWATSDMFFFSYESLQTPIRRNAMLLGEFVQYVWGELSKEFGPTDRNLRYKDLIFAGHSEGAVVVRRLILDRYEAIEQKIKNTLPKANQSTQRATMKKELNSDFIMCSYLRLFAPACRGSNLSSWAGFLTSFSHFVSAITASSLVRNELLPESPVLNSLMTGTEQAHAKFHSVRSLYTRPIFGVPDQIVYSESYQGEEPLWDEGYDHFTVCKPDYTHKRPLEFVCK